MKHVALLLTLVVTGGFSLGCGGGGGGNLPTCGAFSPCGGDITGTWSFDSVCTEGNITDSLLSTADLPAACRDIVKSFSLEMRGTLTYSDNTETSDVTMSMTVRVVYSSACIAAEAGAPVTVTQALCDTISSSAGSTDGPSMSCRLASGGCDCTMTMAQSTQGSDSYTVSGSTLTYSDGDTLEFCVSGNNLSVRPSADPGSPAMQFRLHRT